MSNVNERKVVLPLYAAKYMLQALDECDLKCEKFEDVRKILSQWEMHQPRQSNDDNPNRYMRTIRCLEHDNKELRDLLVSLTAHLFALLPEMSKAAKVRREVSPALRSILNSAEALKSAGIPISTELEQLIAGQSGDK